MKYKKRRFTSGECMHVYQRTKGGMNIFYDLEDYIVFYTVFSVVSKLYKISVLELCMMIDHVHILLSSEVLSEISRFIQHYTSLFMREYNNGIGRKGSLFHKSFGSAPKKGSKMIRSAISVITPLKKDCALKRRSTDGIFWHICLQTTPFRSQDLSADIPCVSETLCGRWQDARKEVSICHTLRSDGCMDG